VNVSVSSFTHPEIERMLNDSCAPASVVQMQLLVNAVDRRSCSVEEAFYRSSIDEIREEK
jgi:hypothetical protein